MGIFSLAERRWCLKKCPLTLSVLHPSRRDAPLGNGQLSDGRTSTQTCRSQTSQTGTVVQYQGKGLK